MNRKEIVTGYFYNLVLYSSYCHQIIWNTRYGLPVMDYSERLAELRKEMLLFETVLDGFDRRIRIVLRCRFGLHMSTQETADFLEMDPETVGAIVRRALSRMDSQDGE